MKRAGNLILAGFLILLSGCAGAREVGKGFAGVSTRVLEQNRSTALKKSFALDHNQAYLKTREVLRAAGSEIYTQDHGHKLLAVYFSYTDTTPVGVFFTEETPGNILVEISSPSIYAKETIAQRVFAGLKELAKPAAQEKKTDVKEKAAK